MAITLEQLRAALDTDAITSIVEQTDGVSIDVDNYYKGIASLKLSYKKLMSIGENILAFYSIPVTTEAYKYFSGADSLGVKFILKEPL